MNSPCGLHNIARAGVAFCLLSLGFESRASNVIPIDPSVQYQTWEGFGTSLAWWANIIGAYPEPLRTTLVTKAISDLKLNVLRYNIGGGEAPGLQTMEVRARVPGYLSSTGKYDWTADAAQRWVLAKGIALGANKFEAFSNSPPYFMTVSGSVTGGVNGADNLAPAHLNDFTSYLAHVVQHFQTSWGVKFETLEPMNEPAAPWWTYGGRQEGCRVSPGDPQSNLIVSTAAALKSLKLTTQVSACDESLNDWAVSSWDQLSVSAKSNVRRLNTHCYGGTSQHWVNHRAGRDQKRLWMSEYGDGDASGLTMAHEIVNDLRNMMPTAWVYWQVIDGGSGWGCIDMDLNNKSKQYTINPKFYALAQFSKFIRPGANFLAIGDGNSVSVLNGTQLVIVSVSDSATTATYDLTRFTKLGAKVSVTQTSPNGNLVSLPSIAVSNKGFSVNEPANSITTMVIDGCAFNGTVYSGFQTIASKKTSKVLAVPGGSWDQGTNLTTSTYAGSFAQQWRVEGYGNGLIKLCNRDSGLYAALWDSAPNNYPILQWSDNGDTTLQWTRSPLSDGSVRLIPYRYGGKALTENPTRGNGWSDVAIYDWYQGLEQKWIFKSVSPFYPNLVSYFP